MEGTYTYILDFRGGTYVSQVKSKSLDESVNMWVKYLKKTEGTIQFLDRKSILEIEKQFQDEDNRTPRPLDGLSNVWCLDILTKQGFGLINIIKTEI